ncbi:cupredoxin domain-containing protein [Candidatus Roizmanbacteria bacterium]|nr:MAG: cupredoxin domain-containing protein [Candidatus Roizmanbacteria bacterium]
MEQAAQSPKGNSNMLIIGAVIIVAVVAAGIFMTQNNQNSQAVNTDTTTETESQTDDSMAPDTTTSGSGEQSAAGTSEEAVQIVEVEAGSFYYKPNEIRVKQGDKVRIVMNSVSMMHDFVIDELGVKMPVVQNGDTGTVEFTVTEKGTFEYYCSVGEHRAQGQVGTLIVE